MRLVSLADAAINLHQSQSDSASSAQYVCFFEIDQRRFATMKYGVFTLGTIGILGLSNLAFAEKAPDPRVGFQMDIRTGYSLPMGSYWKNADLSDVASGQVPFIFDIGGKVIPALFVGGYFGLGFGGAGGTSADSCKANGASCSAVAFHLGVEAQYHILPAGQVNPWVGYGLGYESLGAASSKNGVTTSSSVGGFEFARLMGGVDFRLTRVFGVGPFVDLSMATYSSGSNGVTIQDTAMHQWLTFGARFVFFP
jgi:hypothetical protein